MMVVESPQHILAALIPVRHVGSATDRPEDSPRPNWPFCWLPHAKSLFESLVIANEEIAPAAIEIHGIFWN